MNMKLYAIGIKCNKIALIKCKQTTLTKYDTKRNHQNISVKCIIHIFSAK